MRRSVAHPCRIATDDLRASNGSLDERVGLELVRFMSCELSADGMRPSRRLALDLGMNHGQSSVQFLRQGFRVVAVEANPGLALSFRAKAEAAARAVWPASDTNAKLRLFDEHMTVLNRAISTSDDATLKFCLDRQDVTSHVLQEGGRCKDRVVEVGAVSCSTLIRLHGRPELLKVDVEGLELACLRSLASLTPSQLPPAVTFESPLWTCTSAACADSFVEVVSVLEQLNYTDWKRQWWGDGAGHGVVADALLDCGRSLSWVSARVVRDYGCGQTKQRLGQLPQGSKHTYGACDFHARLAQRPGGRASQLALPIPQAQRLLLILYFFGDEMRRPELVATRASIVANAAGLGVLLLTDSDAWQPAANLHVIRTSVDTMRERLAAFASARMGAEQCSLFGGDLCARGGCCGCQCCEGGCSTSGHARINASALLPTLGMINDAKPLLPLLYRSELTSALAPDPNDLVGYGDLDVVYGDVRGFLDGQYPPWPALSRFDIVGTNGHLTSLRWRLWIDHVQHNLPADLLRALLEYRHFNDFARWMLDTPGLFPDLRPPLHQGNMSVWSWFLHKYQGKIENKDPRLSRPAQANVSVITLQRRSSGNDSMFTDVVPLDGGWPMPAYGPVGFTDRQPESSVHLRSLEWSWVGASTGDGPSLTRETVDGERAPTIYAHRFFKRFASPARINRWSPACESGRVLHVRWEMAADAEMACAIVHAEQHRSEEAAHHRPGRKQRCSNTTADQQCLGLLTTPLYTNGVMQLRSPKPECELLSIEPQSQPSVCSQLKGASLLLVGDSVDRDLMAKLPSVLNRTFRRLQLIPKVPSSPEALEVQDLNYSTGAYVARSYPQSVSGSRMLVEGCVEAAFFVNFGLRPPYWRFESQYAAHSRGILGNASSARVEALGKIMPFTPTVVFVQSYAWDYAAWWMVQGEPVGDAREWITKDHVEQWAHDLPAYLQAVRRAFPSSLLVWRTAVLPQESYARGQVWRATPDAIALMNEVARAVATRLGFLVLDWGSTFEDLESSQDGVHTADHSNPNSQTVSRQTKAMWQSMLGVVRWQHESGQRSGAC